jgi:rare lipoprotein A
MLAKKALSFSWLLAVYCNVFASECYTIRDQSYCTFQTAQGYSSEGTASWYGRSFQGRTMASGQPYNMFLLTAASPFLPINSLAKVTNLKNGKMVVVRVTDRGPFHTNRIMDLSYAAAQALNIIQHGTAKVRITALTSVQQWTKFGKKFLTIAHFAQHDHARLAVKNLQMRVALPVFIRTHHHRYTVMLGPIESSEHLQRVRRFLIREGWL